MNNEQKNILSKLEKVPTQVPDDAFFDALKTNVVDKINTEVKIVPFYKKTWLQIAASAILLLGIGTFYLTNNKETPAAKQEKVDFSSLSKDDIIHYIEENQEDFDNEELAALLTDDPMLQANNPEITHQTTEINLKKKSVKSMELEKMWREIDDEEILNYLEEENYDVDDEIIW